MMLPWGFLGCRRLLGACSRARRSPMFGKSAWARDAASSSSCSRKVWEDVGCGVTRAMGLGGSRTRRYGVQGWRMWGVREQG